MRRNPAAFALYGVLAVGLIAGTTAFVNLDKTVTVTVDGAPRQVRTFATTVGGVLDRSGIVVGEHDTLFPTREVSVSDGTLIAVRRGRLLSLTVDGQAREVWVTADTVDEALNQAGVGSRSAVVSASRSGRVPLSGLSVDLRNPQDLTVTVDGQTRDVVTTELTIGAALKAAGIDLGPSDKISLGLQEYPTSGQQVVIVRINSVQVSEQGAVPFATEKRDDATLLRGTTKVVQEGRNGVFVRTYQVTYTDGAITDKQVLGDELVSAPVTKIIAVGTKVPPPPPKPVFPTLPAASLNWAALRNCESGGNYGSRSAPFYGAYQFMLGTWASVGGKGNPADASRAEQDYRAQLLYQRSGRAPWPVCGRLL